MYLFSKILNNKVVQYKFSSFITIVILLLIYLFAKDVTEFYHDSRGYWEYGRTFMKDGEFHLYHYNFSIRGYLLPLICFLIQSIAEFFNANEYVVFRIICAVVFAYSLTIILPNFFTKIFHTEFRYLSRLLFAVLIIYFWDGLLLYPLSDLPALILVIISLNYMIDITKNMNQQSLLGLIFKSILLGICLAGAYYIRPIYLIVLILTLAYLLLFTIFGKSKNLLTRGLTTFLIILGLMITAVPQIIINSNNFETKSPMIQTQYNNPSNRSLYLTQLEWGIYIQRYESNVGVSYPSPQVFFEDSMGKKILETEGVNYISTYKEFFSLVLRYPIDFICIYIRHLFNGLDQVYSDIFIKDINQSRILFSWLNYSILFTALSIIFYKFKRAKKGFFDYLKTKLHEASMLIIFLSTVILSIPTAVETRFFLPVYILMYILVCNIVTIQNIKRLQVKLLFKKYFIVYLLFIIACFVLSSTVFTSIEHGYTVMSK